MRSGTFDLSTLHLLAASAIVTVSAGLFAPDVGAAASGKPRWVLHVEHYSGSISNGVRFSLDPDVMAARGRYRASVAAPASIGIDNVQMNDDSYPELPQNEESIAYSLDNPMIAV